MTRLLTVGCVLLALAAPRASLAQEVIGPGARPTCSATAWADCWRQGETQFLSDWPDVAVRHGDTLAIRLDRWGALTFLDLPPGDQMRLWAFRGVLHQGSTILIDEQDYLGHALWLISPRTEEFNQLPCWIVPSPSERLLYCGEGGIDEMGAHGSVAIYTMEGSSPRLKIRHELGPNDPVDAQWLDDRRVQFTVEPLGGRGGPARCRLMNEANGWRLEECPPPERDDPGQRGNKMPGVRSSRNGAS